MNYGLPVGYSGHETNTTPSIFAAVLGAPVIERHVTLDRAMYGSDQSASLELPGMYSLCSTIRKLKDCLGDGQKRILEEEVVVSEIKGYWSPEVIYVFDIDGTLCELVKDAQYEEARPLIKRINIVNKLYEEGNYIKLYTARGSTTGIDWTEVTKNQLEDWSLKYHELIMNCKPHGDLFVDDKAINADLFFKS